MLDRLFAAAAVSIEREAYEDLSVHFACCPALDVLCRRGSKAPHCYDHFSVDLTQPFFGLDLLSWYHPVCSLVST